MKTLMIIETVHGGMLFSLTYVAAFLLAAGIMIFQGVKKGYPLSNWLLILITGVVFFIIGDKVFTYSPGQWLRVLTEFQFPAAIEKNALGGIIGLFAGIFLARFLLRFNRPVFDLLAIALPVAMAVSRIGCLMAGCCFGTPTVLPLGIKYDAASMAYHAQMAQGLIDLHEPGSLAVHPVQLYQVIGCLFIAFIVWMTRNRWKSNGSLFLFSVLCYGFMRFFVEFLVDAGSNSFAGKLLWGMNPVQWLIVVAFLPGLIALIIRESGTKTPATNGLPIKVSEFRKVLLAGILGILIFRGRNWFDLIEFSTMMLFFIPVVILLIVTIYRNHSVAGFRWVLPALLICSISFMAQKSSKTGTKDDKIIFTEFGIAGTFGKYAEELQRVSVMCGYQYQTLTRQSVPIYQAEANLSYNIWRGRYTKYKVGGRIFFGDEFPEQTTISSGSGPIYGISPYADLNWRYFGFSAGFSLGHVKIPIAKPVSKLHDGDIISKNQTWAACIPSFGVRLGPADVLYAEAFFPGLFPSGAPYPTFRAGIGTGLGKANGTKVAAGYCYQGIYGQLVYPIKNKILLSAIYVDNFQTGDQASRIFSFGFNYRFINEDKYKEQIKTCSVPYYSMERNSVPDK